MQRRAYYSVFLWSLVIVIGIAAGMYMFSGLTNRHSVGWQEEDETTSDKLYTVQTADGATLFQTAWPVQDGDRFFSAQNIWYQLDREETNGCVATAVPVSAPENFQPVSLPARSGQKIGQPPAVKSGLVGPDGEERDTHVIIYHTHSDESYGYGTNVVSKPGAGDVYEVGERLSQDLRALGASVTHSYAAHDPHDASAYERSRKTLLSLLPEQPDLVIDLHRDSAPVDAYVTTINGQLTARVMLVVGAANPTMDTNLQYAYAFKETADAIYPDLVRGIYIGKGSYNQDIYPSAMLMEFGTDGMSRDTAEKSAACVSDVLQTYLTEVLPYLPQR